MDNAASVSSSEGGSSKTGRKDRGVPLSQLATIDESEAERGEALVGFDPAIPRRTSFPTRWSHSSAPTPLARPMDRGLLPPVTAESTGHRALLFIFLFFSISARGVGILFSQENYYIIPNIISLDFQMAAINCQLEEMSRLKYLNKW